MKLTGGVAVNMLIRYLVIGLIIAIFSWIKVAHNLTAYGVTDNRLIVGLLSLVAVGLFGLIWRKTSSTQISSVTIIAIFVFIGSFFLSDNQLIGSEIMIAVVLSFIVSRIFGLLALEKITKD